MEKDFFEIVQLIKKAQKNALKAVNAELINLYWNIGEYVSKKVSSSQWGDGVVTE